MNYVILFDDNEEFSSKRQEYMKDHLAFLESNSSKISAAGPLFDEIKASSAGGIWIISADSKQDAEALVKEDPFWPTGLRKSYRILSWKQVYADGKRLIHP